MNALTDLTRALRRRRLGGRPMSGAPDPFVTLGLQIRLSRIATEIRHLERDGGRWARAHHLTAATAAYDDLLVEAARLCDLPVPDADAPIRRLIIESQLRHRGWAW